jgi:hypothetical protein
MTQISGMGIRTRGTCSPTAMTCPLKNPSCKPNFGIPILKIPKLTVMSGGDRIICDLEDSASVLGCVAGGACGTGRDSLRDRLKLASLQSIVALWDSHSKE